MAITQSDWIKDTQWSEYHLTPKGWVSGTVRTEKGRYESATDPPPGRLLTIRSLSCVPSDWKDKPRDWTEIRWATKDVARLKEAQDNWGVLPYTGPLSDESAAAFSDVPGIHLMKLPAAARPQGIRARRRRWGGLR